VCADETRRGIDPEQYRGGRRTSNYRDFLAFAHIARGSLAELETQVLLAIRIGLQLDAQAWPQRMNEVGRLMNGLIRSLRDKAHIGSR